MLASVYRSAPRRLLSRNLRIRLASTSSDPSLAVQRLTLSSSATGAENDLVDWTLNDSDTKNKTFHYGKLYNKKSGKSFQRKSASLPVTTLGKGAKVLILESVQDDMEDRPSVEHTRNEKGHSDAIIDANPSHVDTVPDVLDSADSLGNNLENALATLDGMRPETSRQTGSTVLTQDQMNELARLLHKQFSLVQLKEYASRHKPAVKLAHVPESLLDQPLSKPWNWDRTTLVIDAGVKVKTVKQTQKAIVVSSILERIWGLKAETDTDQNRAAVRILPRQMHQLITAGCMSFDCYC
jgi:hypothetical protein